MFMRSSKALPTEWRHWESEIWWQIHGLTSMVEDHVMRSRNVLGKFNTIFLLF